MGRGLSRRRIVGFVIAAVLVSSAPIALAGPASATGTLGETTGGVTNTWTDYSDAGGTQGPSIPSNDTVQVTCRVTGFRGRRWEHLVVRDRIVAVEQHVLRLGRRVL